MQHNCFHLLEGEEDGEEKCCNKRKNRRKSACGFVLWKVLSAGKICIFRREAENSGMGDRNSLFADGMDEGKRYGGELVIIKMQKLRQMP